MTSAQKPLLSLAATLALLGWSGLLVAASAVALGRLDPESLRMPLLLAALTAFPVFWLAISLMEEFVRVLRGDAYDPDDENAMTFAEACQLIRWCPRVLQPAPLLVPVLLVVMAWGMGFTSWNSTQPLDAQRAIGLCAFVACFHLFCQPILSSASRMPGTFADHFRPEATPSR